MSNPGKAMFALLVLLTVLTYIVYRSDVTVVDVQKEKYNSAIQTASQTAVLNIIDTSDINRTYDGALVEASDIPINFESLDKFRSTLSQSLASKKSTELGGVSNINIPLVGFVTYEYIVGVTFGEAYDDINTFAKIDTNITYEQYKELKQNGTDKTKVADIENKLRQLSGDYLLPSGYTFYAQSPSLTSSEYNVNNKTWRFTLGNVIYIPSGDKLSTDAKYIGEGTKLYKADAKGQKVGAGFELKGYIKQLGFNTFEQLRNYVVMASINEYLNAYSGVGFNKTSSNTGAALDFNLGTQNYSANKEEYNKNSTIIEGPGMFAIIDIYKGSGNKTKLYERMASFGGSELVQKNLEPQHTPR